jgi:hypothetical protein
MVRRISDMHLLFFQCYPSFLGKRAHLVGYKLNLGMSHGARTASSFICFSQWCFGAGPFITQVSIIKPWGGKLELHIF